MDELQALTQQEFPYFAWEQTSRTVVEVERHHHRIAYLTDGRQALLKDLMCPDWLVEAQNAAEDFADEQETMEDVRYG